jgi:hypothetical protein
MCVILITDSIAGLGGNAHLVFNCRPQADFPEQKK